MSILTPSSTSSLPLEESAELLSAALRAAGVGTWAWDAETGELRWSAACHHITGTNPETFRTTFRTCMTLVHPDDAARVAATIERLVSERRESCSLEVEHRIVRPDGTVRWVSSRGQISRGDDGRPLAMVGLTFDVTEQRLADAALRRSEEHARAQAEELRVLMEGTPVMIWIARDPECRTIVGNRVAHECLRMPMGANLSKTAPEGDPAPHFKVLSDGRELSPEELPVQRAARGEEIRAFEEEVVFEDGERLHLYGNAVPLLSPDGAVRGAVSAFIDITSRKRAEDALRESEARKDEFLAMLAHELRNPLAAIRSAAQTMRHLVPERSELGRLHGIVGRQTEHLARLVDDLLDVSRIHQGKIELHEEEVELSAIVARAVETSRPLLDSRGHRLTLSLPKGRVLLRGDPVRLVQILLNLLDNAAKYTPPAGHLQLAAETSGEQLVVRVQDDGVGIPPEVLPRIFDLFTQAERTLDRGQGGLGIGLTVVKRLVELHGGTVEARSDGVGKGTLVLVRLPIPAPSPEPTFTPPPDPSSPLETTPLASRRILVVDDNTDAADALAMLLEMDGHEIRSASDGPAAVETARVFRPHIVLLDIGLPGMDGYEVASRLRAQPETRATHLIALTGYGRAQDRARSRTAGIDHHLTKPVSYEAVASLVESLEARTR